MARKCSVHFPGSVRAVETKPSGSGSSVTSASGFTTAGDPYMREFLRDGVLRPGQTIVVPVTVRRGSHGPAIDYRLKLLSGQGTP